MAIASYRPNAFHRSDMELLSNMARHAALALDNAFRHAQVEEQSYLDSLTGAYNHRHFLLLLAELGDEALRSGNPLSLIMLDVDHFKQYNDRYGHLAGDAVLRALCHTIKSHFKRTDVLGRWGGEEFSIALPNARGDQARQVADRVRATMATLEISGLQEKTFPAPTVSQGIAEFPVEVQDVIGLVDLADHRLYVAKERGRDQVEPSHSHWDVGERAQVSGAGMAGRPTCFRF
jgi:diguanylate cyclase (GGDEF)-like protein